MPTLHKGLIIIANGYRRAADCHKGLVGDGKDLEIPSKRQDTK